MSLLSWLRGDSVPATKYDYLKNKYEELIIEFRRYREKSEIKERNNKRLITELRNQQLGNSEMWAVALPYIISGQPMKHNDKIRMSDLAKKYDIYNPL